VLFLPQRHVACGVREADPRARRQRRALEWETGSSAPSTQCLPRPQVLVWHLSRPIHLVVSEGTANPPADWVSELVSPKGSNLAPKIDSVCKGWSATRAVNPCATFKQVVPSPPTTRWRAVKLSCSATRAV